MDNFFEKPQKRDGIELNLVPIIDMLTTVIFFLLLSTVFIAMNKLTVPPSKVSTVSDPIAPPPLAATLLVGADQAQQKVEVRMSWTGKAPGQMSQSIAVQDLATKPDALVEATHKLADQFHQRFPDEKTVRVGMSRELPYQYLISAMDGVRDAMPDLVLISYQESEARFKGGTQ